MRCQQSATIGFIFFFFDYSARPEFIFPLTRNYASNFPRDLHVAIINKIPSASLRPRIIMLYLVKGANKRLTMAKPVIDMNDST